MIKYKRANSVIFHKKEQSKENASKLTLSGRFVTRGLGRLRDVEVGRHVHVVPLLLDERMSTKAKKKES